MRRLAALVSTMLLSATGVPGPGTGSGAGPTVVGTTISGVVFDSLAMRGLSGASVQLADSRDGTLSTTVTSDSAGRFTLSDVRVGTYLLGFFHPKLDSLSISSQTLRVDVRTEQPMQVRLAIPSARTLARSMCGAKAVSDSTGLVLGYIRGADNSMPRGDAKLNVRWAEFVIERNSIQRLAPSVDASSGAAGMFALCGVPIGVPLLMQASTATDSSGAFELTVPASGILHRDVFVAPVVRAKVTVSDSAPAVELLRGSGRLRGQVIGSTGRPIANARVMVWGTGIEATSNADGEFSLAALPGGTHTLEVRAVGFSPQQRPVDIVYGTAGSTEVELATLGITLDTVRVTAQRVYTSRREADFERRMKMNSGSGHIIGEAEIEKRKPHVLTDLLRTVPGVQVLPGQRSGEDVYMRGGLAILGTGLCRPDLYLDGMRVANDALFPFNALVSTAEVRAVEVYAHAALVPVELQTTSGCGVIVVWTGARRRS